jgi:site-specific DNA-methyltransferase (adenine-specific)
MFTLHNGDCLAVSDKVESGIVDLILSDLPYGNMDTDGGRRLGINGWDVPIAPKDIYNISERILRKNGKLVLFSQEPYTTELLKNQINNISFCYKAIWEKDNFAMALGVNKNMVSMFEDVLIFSKSVEDKTLHPLQDYFIYEFGQCGFSVKEIIEFLGTTHASHFFTAGKQFRTPNEKYLNLLKEKTGRFQIEYKKVVEAQSEFLECNRKNYPSTFNLWEGKKYKSNVLKYSKDYDGLHPTQKPVLLIEDLIKTFSNEGDLVVDFTMGSGTTIEAAERTGRNSIGIEKDEGIFQSAVLRLKSFTPSNTA